jgi:hypothetical protein
MNLEKPTDLEMWWPSPSAFSDLTVEDTEEGFSLEAPDGSECASWIAYWDQDEEHRKFFEKEFTKVLIDYVQTLENQHGESKVQFDGQNDHRVEAQEECSRVLS